jgi:hypothetical protein
MQASINEHPEKGFLCVAVSLRVIFKHLPRPPTRNDSWKTVGSITRPSPSLGGKMKPRSKRIKPREKPATGPAAASFSRSSRLRTILTILVMAPKDPIYNK